MYIKFPEGEVKTVHDDNNNLLWQKAKIYGVSWAGAAPISGMTIGTARSNVAALGSGYYQQDYASMWTLRMLFLVEWATWDGQSVIQNTTNYSSYSDIRTGSTDAMAYHTGISANGYGTQYRYVEDPWENTLEWVDGIYTGTCLYTGVQEVLWLFTALGLCILILLHLQPVLQFLPEECIYLKNI